ncbi:MAG TPA: hypothetical protein VFJ02_09965 [Vicinamibacterales bacterium]|nr:hypothetical protein [Vicinamibacterales bacterium]
MRPFVAALVAAIPLGVSLASSTGSAAPQAGLDLTALARQVREALRREYSTPPRFTYVEKRRDVEISKLGKVSVGPLRTFEVYPRLDGDDYKRLIAIDDKPLDPAELARRDEEHRRNEQRREERERSESPQRRAERLRRIAEEARERDAILDDAAAVYELRYAGRETIAGDGVLVVALHPRPHVRVTTREGEWMKLSEGRMWVAENGHHVARLRIHAVDDLSIGWGVVARVDPGSGFDYIRKRIGDTWVPLELAIEGSGRTLLFRRFQVKTVTTYSDHRPQNGTTRSGSQ